MRVKMVFTFSKALAAEARLRAMATVFESLLLLEQIKGRKFDPHERIPGPTNHASGAMLVPDPEGHEFEPGHSQLRNR
jgi:hypothetical protein